MHDIFPPCIRMYIYISIHTHTQTRTHTHIHTYTHTFTHVHAHTNTRAHTHAHTHTRTHTHTHTHTHTQELQTSMITSGSVQGSGKAGIKCSYLQILVVIPEEVQAYKEFGPENAAIFELPAGAKDWGIGFSRYYTKKLAELLCPKAFPFCLFMDDSVQYWRGMCLCVVHVSARVCLCRNECVYLSDLTSNDCHCLSICFCVSVLTVLCVCMHSCIHI